MQYVSVHRAYSPHQSTYSPLSIVMQFGVSRVDVFPNSLASLTTVLQLHVLQYGTISAPTGLQETRSPSTTPTTTITTAASAAAARTTTPTTASTSTSYYTRITSGTCISRGYSYITSSSECYSAMKSLFVVLPLVSVVQWRFENTYYVRRAAGSLVEA